MHLSYSLRWLILGAFAISPRSYAQTLYVGDIGADAFMMDHQFRTHYDPMIPLFERNTLPQNSYRNFFVFAPYYRMNEFDGFFKVGNEQISPFELGRRVAPSIAIYGDYCEERGFDLNPRNRRRIFLASCYGTSYHNQFIQGLRSTGIEFPHHDVVAGRGRFFVHPREGVAYWATDALRDDSWDRVFLGSIEFRFRENLGLHYHRPGIARVNGSGTLREIGNVSDTLGLDLHFDRLPETESRAVYDVKQLKSHLLTPRVAPAATVPGVGDAMTQIALEDMGLDGPLEDAISFIGAPLEWKPVRLYRRWANFSGKISEAANPMMWPGMILRPWVEGRAATARGHFFNEAHNQIRINVQGGHVRGT